MRPVSPDPRERVRAESDAGIPTKQAAAKYRVCQAGARRLERRRGATGPIAPKARRHGPPPRGPGRSGPVAGAVEERPDATPAELRRAGDLPPGVAASRRIARDPGLTFEEMSLRAAERDRPDVKRRREGRPAETAGAASGW